MKEIPPKESFENYRSAHEKLSSAKLNLIDSIIESLNSINPKLKWRYISSESMAPNLTFYATINYNSRGECYFDFKDITKPSFRLRIYDEDTKNYEYIEPDNPEDLNVKFKKVDKMLNKLSLYK